MADGRLTFGHAKVLAGFADDPAKQDKLARAVLESGLSVRALEALAGGGRPGAGGAATTAKAETKSQHVQDLERRLTERLGVRVRIRPGRKKNRGKLVIDYYSLEDFDRLLEAFGLSELEA
jgi:ParB family chromosome partitioning protein